MYQPESFAFMNSFTSSFVALSYHMSYHLLKLLFSTICDLMSSTDAADRNAVECLRHFLTCGLGSRIIGMMSADLDLSVSQPQTLSGCLP